MDHATAKAYATEAAKNSPEHAYTQAEDFQPHDWVIAAIRAAAEGAYNEGHDDGKDEGYDDGYFDGEMGVDDRYDDGYSAGYNDARDELSE